MFTANISLKPSAPASQIPISAPIKPTAIVTSRPPSTPAIAWPIAPQIPAISSSSKNESNVITPSKKWTPQASSLWRQLTPPQCSVSDDPINSSLSRSAKTMPALISCLLQREEHGLNMRSSSSNSLNDCFFIQKSQRCNHIDLYGKGAKNITYGWGAGTERNSERWDKLWLLMSYCMRRLADC
jgi:hypothetical protein